MSIVELLNIGKGILGVREYMDTSLEVSILLAHTLKVNREYILTHIYDEVSDDKEDYFLKLLKKRKLGYPLQYIVESQEFMGLDFKVSEGVLIPRGDTEILVEKVIEISKNIFSKENTINILEIGTGSGAISVSLAYYIEKAKVYTVDIEEVPFEMGKLNAKAHGLEDKIKFYLGDLFEPIKKACLEHSMDIIVSNPPYIESSDIETLQTEIDYEPITALDGGYDGLDFYRRIVKESTKYLKANGLLAFEIGHNQGIELKKLMNENYRNLEIVKDYSGVNRVIYGYRK